MQNDFYPGQRWVSESEPELGLGSIVRVTNRTVVIGFGASKEQREYAKDNSPLRRVRFRKGDSVKSSEGKTFVVRDVIERGGIIYYSADGHDLCETELSDAINFDKPEDRLLAGQVDEPNVFDLRYSALKQQYRRRKSKVRGFVGGRIDLIPHQLYISSEVSGRLMPRVLLADEVGLGKTIEACLIVHRLILTGRAQRVLILVPESLVHQWFVELLRRFNLWFHIFDEERCAAIEGVDQETNPFLDDQLVLCSLALFTRNERRLPQALAAGWDILVVDEAHHLGWSAETVSPEYAVVEALGRKTPGLLLLTATPEQVGVASHFARLRLLDPDRFFDLNQFINESERYRDVARVADKLLGGKKLEKDERELLAALLVDTEENVREKTAKIEKGDIAARDQILQALLDQHGTGRVMFRNTRTAISGFPKRIARLQPLHAFEEHEFQALAEEFDADTNPKAADAFEPNYDKDLRVRWLADLLRALDAEKILLICRTQRKVEAIEAALRQLINVKMGVFHEGLPLVQRDRNAAWFAEENGARILICSEIGSEGRNFQFAHHLVLFDLPLNPELLEQRIGRLDRIGQTSEIQVHLPFIVGSSQEVLVRWYHEGLNSVERNLHGGLELLQQFEERLRDLAQDFHETEKTSRTELESLIAETQKARKALTVRLEQGKDRLLELNSFRPEVAKRLIGEISLLDQDSSLDDFLISVLDHYSIHVEDLGQRSYQLGSAGVFADAFPGLPAAGMTITCLRSRALSREDVQFVTWDHPLVTAAIDLLLGSEKGTSSFGKWIDPRNRGVYVEGIYVLECIAPRGLHMDRFLPPTPLRVIVDHRGSDMASSISSDALGHQLKKGEAYVLVDQPEFREDLFPVLLEKARTLADQRTAAIIADAQREMNLQLDGEISRLQDLRKVNASVRPEEIELLVKEKNDLRQHIGQARLRLDAVRLIQRGPG